MSNYEESEILEVEGDYEVLDTKVPVPVCVDGAVVNTPAIPQHAVFRTFVLTADNPYLQLLTRDDLRVKATIVALDANVVLTSSRAQAMTPLNLVATLLTPNGAVLTAGTVTDGRQHRFTIETTDEVWATAAVDTYPSRVSVTITRRSP